MGKRAAPGQSRFPKGRGPIDQKHCNALHELALYEDQSVGLTGTSFPTHLTLRLPRRAQFPNEVISGHLPTVSLDRP